MLKNLLTKNYETVPLLAFGVMCALALLGVAVVIKSDFSRDSTTFLSQLSNTICLVFLTLLTGYLVVKKETDGAMRYSMKMYSKRKARKIREVLEEPEMQEKNST